MEPPPDLEDILGQDDDMPGLVPMHSAAAQLLAQAFRPLRLVMVDYGDDLGTARIAAPGSDSSYSDSPDASDSDVGPSLHSS